MEEVKKSGKALSIGVSNFQRPHMEAIPQIASITPAVNDIEFHPYPQRSHDYVPWMQEHGIELSAFKGLAPVTVAKGGPLDGPLAPMAQKHNVIAAAVLLRWHLNQNCIATTKTRKKERISEYLEGVTLKLSVEEQEEITQSGLQHHYRWWGTQFFEPDDLS
jgi:diketogulonate reductase-like aldo/keto reductase